MHDYERTACFSQLSYDPARIYRNNFDVGDVPTSLVYEVWPRGNGIPTTINSLSFDDRKVAHTYLRILNNIPLFKQWHELLIEGDTPVVIVDMKAPSHVAGAILWLYRYLDEYWEELDNYTDDEAPDTYDHDAVSFIVEAAKYMPAEYALPVGLAVGFHYHGANGHAFYMPTTFEGVSEIAGYLSTGNAGDNKLLSNTLPVRKGRGFATPTSLQGMWQGNHRGNDFGDWMFLHPADVDYLNIYKRILEYEDEARKQAEFQELVAAEEAV